jgi:ribose-phosphate pyrophosphokinase
LLKEGATKVYAACTHPVLSGPAVERICASQHRGSHCHRFRAAQRRGQKVSRIKVLSVAELLARGIHSIHEESSISELFF